jgi:hypothetical protein
MSKWLVAARASGHHLQLRARLRNRAAADADVALVGDSYVEGTCNDDADVVARRLGRGGRPVASLAVIGFGTMQELVVIDRIAPFARGDRVVLLRATICMTIANSRP